MRGESDDEESSEEEDTEEDRSKGKKPPPTQFQEPSASSLLDNFGFLKFIATEALSATSLASRGGRTKLLE